MVCSSGRMRDTLSTVYCTVACLAYCVARRHGAYRQESLFYCWFPFGDAWTGWMDGMMARRDVPDWGADGDASGSTAAVLCSVTDGCMGDFRHGRSRNCVGGRGRASTQGRSLSMSRSASSSFEYADSSAMERQTEEGLL